MIDTCEVCGATSNLEEHHLLPQRYNGPDKEWNLVTLCEDCHNDIEGVYDSEFFTQLGLDSPDSVPPDRVTFVDKGTQSVLADLSDQHYGADDKIHEVIRDLANYAIENNLAPDEIPEEKSLNDKDERRAIKKRVEQSALINTEEYDLSLIKSRDYAVDAMILALGHKAAEPFQRDDVEDIVCEEAGYSGDSKVDEVIQHLQKGPFLQSVEERIKRDISDGLPRHSISAEKYREENGPSLRDYIEPEQPFKTGYYLPSTTEIPVEIATRNVAVIRAKRHISGVEKKQVVRALPMIRDHSLFPEEASDKVTELLERYS